tara:strand:- start:8006 stop:8386 length:381 start_codon:yes stop_codon:yes gene_type:complete
MITHNEIEIDITQIHNIGYEYDELLHNQIGVRIQHPISPKVKVISMECDRHIFHNILGDVMYQQGHNKVIYNDVIITNTYVPNPNYLIKNYFALNYENGDKAHFYINRDIQGERELTINRTLNVNG